MDDSGLVNIKRSYRFGFAWRAAWIALAIHTLGLIVFAWFNRTNYLFMMFWGIIDLPSSLILIFPREFHGYLNPDNRSELTVVINSIEFGILGGLQYFTLTGLLVGFFKRSRHPIPSDLPSQTPSSITQPSPEPSDPYAAPHADLSKR